MAAKTETRRLGENFILRNIRINWADHLFEVDDGDYGNGKYGCDILIDKSDTETVKKITDFTINLIKQACEKQPNGRPLLDTSTMQAHVREITDGKVPDYRDFSWLLKDGDAYRASRVKKAQDEGRDDADKRAAEYEGRWFIKVTSNNQPRLYDRAAKRFDLTDKKALAQARDLFHSGAEVNANLYIFVNEPSNFCRDGSVSAWLNGMQFVDEGERWAGSVDDGFTPLEDPKPADPWAVAGSEAPSAGSESGWGPGI